MGGIKRIVISIKNISKLKHAELQIKLKEEYYRTITENITDYLYKIYYNKGNISVELESPGVERIIGYKIKELTSSDMILNQLLSSDARRKVPFILKSVIKEKRSRAIEHQVIHKSGQLKWLSNSIIYRDPDTDGSYRLIGVVKDITLQKHLEIALLEAEERYRNVFDYSGMASNVFDLSGKLIMQNLQAAKIMGGVPSDFVGHNIEELYPKEVARHIREVFQETLATGHVNRETEFDVFKKKLWLRTSTHVIKNVHGEIIGIQFISQNITERKEMDKKVLNVILETEEKERMKFAQELHDGVGPLLSAIKIYVQWLGMPQVNVSRSEILADIEKTVDESLLAVKEISYRLNPGNLVKLGLTDALKEFADKINKIGKIKISIESNLNKRFEIRKETILYRVLCESINNTLKYANANEIKIQLNLNENKLLINYTDNGIGFDLNLAGNKGSGLKNMKNRLKSIAADVLFKTEPGKGIELSVGIMV
jgi:PAS domain S-box-containing protein